MVWDRNSTSGVGDLVKINEIMNAENYHQILFHHGILSGKDYSLKNYKKACLCKFRCC